MSTAVAEVRRVPAAHSIAALKRKKQRGTLHPMNDAVLTALNPYWDKPHAGLHAAGIAALTLFVARKGHARVPHNHREGEFLLGPWVSNRRTDHRKGSLSAAKTTELESFPGWTWDPAEDEFRTGLAILDLFVAREGHAVVPGLHQEQGFALGNWTSKRRLDQKRGQLSDSRRAALEQRAGWTWDPLADEYRRAVALLGVYVAREGHALVPGRHQEQGFGLGSWTVKRRSDFKAGKVSAAHAAELEAHTGWSWDPNADEYRLALTRLDTFIAREGHARVPRHHIEQGFSLGKWVANRRNSRGRATASPEQTAEISSRPGWSWDPLADDFRDGLTALDSYVSREGHANAPQRHVENGLPLGKWVTARRADQRKGSLNTDRAAELAARSGWTWNPAEDSFDRALHHLDAFVEEHGHARVPRNHTVSADTFNLGKWVDNRRGEHRRGTLSAARTAALEGRVGWTWEGNAR